MRHQNSLFHGILKFVPWRAFDQLVEKHGSDELVRKFTTRNQLITLLFAQWVYEDVAEAFLQALEARAKKGQDISQIASVASFFVSRIDTLIDGQIDAKLKATTDAKQSALLSSLQGRVAIANAKLTYHKYHEIYGGPRWKALAAKGAQTQRLLWASTSTKNPKYRDVLYVEELIGADTVDTIPPATFDAFRDHGRVRASLTENLDDAGPAGSHCNWSSDRDHRTRCQPAIYGPRLRRLQQQFG